jgi:hypothetical protein
VVDKLPPMNAPGPNVPYLRALEKLVLENAKQGDRTELNLTAIRRGTIATGAANDAAKRRLDELEAAALLPPLPPTGLEGVQEWAWDALGALTSQITLSWDATSKASNGATVTVVSYEVWLREENGIAYRATATGGLTVVVNNLKPNLTYYAAVRGITASGVAGGMTNEILVPAPSPLAPVEAPTPPILLSDMGVVSVSWDGTLSSGPIPIHFDYVDTLMAESADGPWTHVGIAMRRKGGFVISDQPVGSTRYFKFHVHDKFNGVSADSYTSSIEVLGVDLGTLETDLADAQADVAAAQADVDALGNNFSNENLILDPYFKDPDRWALPANSTRPATSAPPVGSTADTVLQVTANSTNLTAKTIATTSTQPGDQWYAEVWVRRTVSSSDTTGTIALVGEVGRPTANGGTATLTFVAISPGEITTSWSRLQGNITIPEFGNSLRVGPQVNLDVANGTFQFTGVILRHVKPAILIADGSIVADKIAAGAVVAGKIAAGSISATEISSGAVTADKISAEAVTAEKIAADSIDANHIKAGAITVSHLEAGIGGQLDISANTSVQLIVGQANAATDTANATSSDLATMQTYYNFGPSGAIISTPSSPFSMVLKNDVIEMKSGETVLSSWSGGQMTVPRLNTPEVVLGNHKLERYGAGTVVRAL